MKVFYHYKELNDSKRKFPAQSIGLVPTMGALHQGHITLVKKAIEENDLVLVSIFVNPTQFDNSSDLKNYPKTLQADLLKLEELNANIWVYAPEANDLYQDKIETKTYNFGTLETTMEGAHRKGHFQGVATVVQKLFEVLNPTRAYFGEKDYQQLQIISEMVKQQNIPVDIIPCPIIRHEDGLAMSSRNQRLNERERAMAPVIYEVLQKAVALKDKHSPSQIESWITDFFKKQKDFDLEYFTIADSQSMKKITTLNGSKTRAFIALKLGEIRLIDNIKF